MTELSTKCAEGNGLNLRSSKANLQIPLLGTFIGQKRLMLSWSKIME